MSWTSLLYLLGGTGLLALALIDIFTTVLHHWGGAGPLSGRLAFRVWKAAVARTGGMVRSGGGACWGVSGRS